MQWKLLSNPGRDDWGAVDLYVIGSKIKRGFYVTGSNRNTICNKFINDEVYGVCEGNCANNLTQTIKNASGTYLKFSEGPIEVTFD